MACLLARSRARLTNAVSFPQIVMNNGLLQRLPEQGVSRDTHGDRCVHFPFICILFNASVTWLTLYLPVFDAVMGQGDLTVPANIQKIEAELKKEWNKRKREARKLLKESEGRGTKRKADQVSTKVSVNVNVQVSNTGAVQVQAAQPSTKRPKVSKSGSAAKPISNKPATAASAATVKAKKAPATKSEKVNPVPKPVKSTAK